MVRRCDNDRNVHHDPKHDCEKQSHQSGFLAAAAEVRPGKCKDYAPDKRKEKVNAGTGYLGQGPQ
jgi:hypothetical protein